MALIERESWNVQVDKDMRRLVKSAKASFAEDLTDGQILEMAVKEWYEEHKGEKVLRGWYPPNKTEADLIEEVLSIFHGKDRASRAFEPIIRGDIEGWRKISGKPKRANDE